MNCPAPAGLCGRCAQSAGTAGGAGVSAEGPGQESRRLRSTQPRARGAAALRCSTVRRDFPAVSSLTVAAALCSSHNVSQFD